MNEDQKRINDLLEQAENLEKSKSEITAFNYLIDYMDCYIIPSLEAERLFILCEEVLQDLIERNE